MRYFYTVLPLLLGLCGSLLFCNCSNEHSTPTAPSETHSPVYGTWQDSSGATYNFNDSVWWSGLNQGTYSGQNEGTLYLMGRPFATFSLANGKLTIHIIADNTTFTMTLSSTTLPINPGTSSLTRKGNFIALTSDRGGDPLGDIYIYSVDSNAYLDTVFYYDTSITQTLVVSYDTVHIDSQNVRIDTLRTTRYDTTLIKKFVEPIRALTNRAGIDDMPAWSPDGKKLAFVSDRGGYRAIWVYFLDGFANPLPEIPGDSLYSKNPVQLTDPKGEQNEANPTWSPDGKSVAFERLDSAGGRDIFIIDSDDYGEVKGARDLTKSVADCFNPEWSPKTDVDIILLEEKNSPSSSDWDVYWMSAKDTVGFDSVSKTNKVTNPNRNGHPTWSPDCRQVAFERNPPGNDSAYDIQIKPFDTKSDTSTPASLTNQTDMPGLNRYPTWLPNGNLIAFMRQNNLWLIDLSKGVGSPTFRQLFDDGYHYWEIAW